MGCGSSTEAVPQGASSNGSAHQTMGGNNSGFNSNNKKHSSPFEMPANPKRAEVSEVNANSGIDRNLSQAREQDELKVKLLLLGAGESGKSTIFKQMRILHGSPRSEDDLRMYGVVVRSNIITAMRKLCTLLRSSNLEAALDEESQNYNSEDEMTPRQAYDLIIAYLVDGTASFDDVGQENGLSNGNQEESQPDWVGSSPRAGLGANNDAKHFLQLWKPIKILWGTKVMREVWTRRAAVNVIDGHRAYLADVARIASPTFVPTQQDILLARVKTTQVVMERYRIEGIEFEMYDVGGQRSERRKWIDCFENVDAVIFVAALSEYDQNLAESRRTNRMVEALELFRSVCNNRAFTETSKMLFLNKKDVFAEKIMYSDIAAQKPFQDYAGPPRDFNNGVLYFIHKFKECLIDDDFNDSFIHVTMATDTNNMEFVLDATRTIIMTDNLRRSGFLSST